MSKFIVSTSAGRMMISWSHVYIYTCKILSTEGLTWWGWLRTLFWRWHFQINFHGWKNIVSLCKFHLNLFTRSNEIYDSIGWDIKNNAWVTVNNDFLSRVRRFDNDFNEWRSQEWKSLPNRLTSDKKSLFTVTNVLFYFLHAILCHEHTNPLKIIIERSFRHCCQGWHFLTQHCDVTTIDLWRHTNARNWYCDVILVDCHCTRKFAQRRSSLVNNNREYQYPATRYSRLSVWENGLPPL